jgi:hypothetical protein
MVHIVMAIATAFLGFVYATSCSLTTGPSRWCVRVCDVTQAGNRIPLTCFTTNDTDARHMTGASSSATQRSILSEITQRARPTPAAQPNLPRTTTTRPSGTGS